MGILGMHGDGLNNDHDDHDDLLSQFFNRHQVVSIVSWDDEIPNIYGKI